MAQIVKRTTVDGKDRYDVRTRIGGRVVTKTFNRKKDAVGYASTVEADKLRGTAIDPRRGQVTVADYASQWLGDRRDLAERTIELYQYLLDRHILPAFGEMALGDLALSDVRRWNASLAKEHPTTAAKAYRLLSSVLKTAVDDDVLLRTPCRVKGAASEMAPERPVASIAEVQAIADAMPDHLCVAVLLAAWCQLRRAELLGLRRRDVDLVHATVSIVVTRTPTMTGEVIEKPPKTEAGRRTLSVPPNVIDDVIFHLSAHVGPEPDALILPISPAVLRHAWDDARASIGRSDLRLHDYADVRVMPMFPRTSS
jgi:integrase